MTKLPKGPQTMSADTTHGRVRLHDGGARLGVTIYNTEYVDPVEKWRELAARILEVAGTAASDGGALAREMASEMVRAHDLLGTFIAEHQDPGANALASRACMGRLLEKARTAGLLPGASVEFVEGSEA